jgi:hypothetical protein
MGPPIHLNEGANHGGDSYLVSGFYGAGSDRCVISGFTEDTDYFTLHANYRCHGGAERGAFTAVLDTRRPHNHWEGPCRQTYPTKVKHGIMTGDRI